MSDSSGAVKENWGEISVSDENEYTPEIEPKSSNPRQEDKKARRSHMLRRWFCLSNFYRGQKMAVWGIHVLTPKTPPSYGIEMVPRIILVTCAKKFSQFGGPQRQGGPMPWNNWHNG